MSRSVQRLPVERGEQDPAGESCPTVELVARYQQGDEEALEQLFRRYYGRVHRIVRVRLGAPLRRRLESVDLVQEVFADAARGLAGFDMAEPAALVRWLATIAENRIRGAGREARADKRELDREVPLGPGAAVEAVEESAARPEARLLAREREALVDACVAELREDWRDVLLLRDYEGGSWEHVSARLGRSIAAAQMLHVRAREALREALVRRGFEG